MLPTKLDNLSWSPEPVLWVESTDSSKLSFDLDTRLCRGSCVQGNTCTDTQNQYINVKGLIL